MRKIAGVGALLFATGFVLWTWAGDLEPTGPPGSTMVTLQEVFDKVGECCGGPSSLAKTGQTGCFDEFGTGIPCAGTGQDGEFQDGVSVDPRFTDNADGTVKDNLTGLIWLTEANCFGDRTWAEALIDANSLTAGFAPCGGLTDGSMAGDWRLPNLRELQSLVDYQNSLPSLPSGHPFTGVLSGVTSRGTFFSSTTVTQPGLLDRAWIVNHDGGGLAAQLKATTVGVWPVRSGQ